jgi:hypothetical protein
MPSLRRFNRGAENVVVAAAIVVAVEVAKDAINAVVHADRSVAGIETTIDVTMIVMRVRAVAVRRNGIPAAVQAAHKAAVTGAVRRR